MLLKSLHGFLMHKLLLPHLHKFFSRTAFKTANNLFKTRQNHALKMLPHLIPISPLSYRAKPKPSETLTPHSSAKKQAILISLPEVGDQLSLYSVLPNLALICDRGSKVSPISNVFVTNMLCDLHVNGSGSYAFLLFRLKMSE